MRIIMLATVIVTLCTGCGGRTANPTMVHQYGDDEKSCKGLQHEMSYIQEEVQRLSKEDEKTGKNTILGVTGAFLIVPLFFIDVSDAQKEEISAYRKRYNYLLQVADDKNCGINTEKHPELTNKVEVEPEETPERL